MKKLLRGIGIGLFLAGALFTLLDVSNEPLTEERTGALEEEVAELQRRLAEANEEMASLKEAASPTEKAEEGQGETTDEQAAPANQAETGESKAVSGTIYIYEGVSPYDIGKQAEDAGIIANSRELELFLSKPEYARSIQKGQFDLNSDMSIEEMAKTLTGKKVD
ncbi:MAG: hypothetical protein ACI33P_15995 [Lysinibacillus sp.]